MEFQRRTILKGLSACALTGLTAAPARAEALLTMGDTRIQTLSDGNLILPRAMVAGHLNGADVDAILTAHNLSTTQFEPACNVTLMRRGARLVLFDVGAGADFMASAGRLFASLEEAGIDPYDVTDVVFTHAHPDHIWGLHDDFGDLAFPEANYYIGADEFAYWMDPNTLESIGAARTTFAVGAARRLSELSERIQLFGAGDEVVPGVRARASYGHTPGHMAFEISDGDEGALLVGDAIGNHHIAFEQPAWTTGSDQNGALGATTRVALLEELANENMPIIGFHLPDGGIGRVEAVGSGYKYRAL